MSRGDRWIIDGNYGGTLDLRVERCDAIVFFDFNRLTCLWGAVKRRLQGRPRPDMTPGNAERLDWGFLRWIWRYREVSRPEVLDAIRQAPPGVEIVTVTTRRAVRELLESLGRAPA